MIISVDKHYYVTLSDRLLGYIGETESRKIIVEGHETSGADRYIMRFSYGNGAQYDIDITSGEYTVQASLLCEVGEVKCQILAVKSTGDTYEYVKKSNIFYVTVEQSVGGDTPVPTYEETVSILEKVFEAESNVEQAAQTATTASNAAQTARTAAEQAATVAEKNKTTAETAAQKADESMQIAYDSASEAVLAKDKAMTAADTATEKATAATSSATAAQSAKEAAETAMDTAVSKAAEIAESASKIADLEAVSHTHDNKSVLDKLNADADENLTYDSRVIMDLDKFFALQRTGKVYGVKVYKATANPTSICEKTRDNAGLVCEPSTDTVEGRDDYADIPLFKWYEVNYKRYDDGFAYPIAFIGDSNYKTDNVDIGAMQMTFYYNWIDDNEEYRELVISDSPNETLGLKPWELAVRADGTVMPYFVQSRYHSVLGSDGLLHSMPGKIARNQSHDNMITTYQKKGAGYWGAGSNRFTFGQIFNLIKYANKSSQDTMQGVTNWNIQYPASVQSEELHNYFPVTNAQAANLQVGLCVSVGYANSDNSLDRGSAEIHKYADDVRITAIETLDDDNKAVYLDCEPFNTMPIVTDDLTRQIYMSSMHARSGDTDCVIGHHDGSPVSNTDSKHPLRIQGIEYLLGAGVIASDTVMCFNEDYSKDVYYAPRGVAHSKTDSAIKSTYSNIGTIPANTDGKGSDWWSGDIVQSGGAWYPINQVSSSGYGNKDICWAGGATASGSREYYQGGGLGGGSHSGLCFLSCWSERSRAYWYYAAAD